MTTPEQVIPFAFTITQLWAIVAAICGAAISLLWFVYNHGKATGRLSTAAEENAKAVSAICDRLDKELVPREQIEAIQVGLKSVREEQQMAAVVREHQAAATAELSRTITALASAVDKMEQRLYNFAVRSAT
jgi:flagellar basal body-associated protein FliL